MKKLIIIPAYNEEACIEKTVENIQKSAPSFDYIIINDCSKDKTKEICEKNQFHFINLSVNLGIGGAVQTGYMYALENHYDVAVQVDGDGQHDAAFLNEMAMFMEENQADMVIGSRFIEKKGFQSSGLRRMGIKFFTGLIKVLTGKTITDPTKLSKGLSGAGNGGVCYQKKYEGKRNSCCYEGEAGRGILNFSKKIGILYD